MRRPGAVGVLIAGALAACGNDPTTYEVTSGLYQLSTAEISGDCALDWSLRPGALTVGSVMPADVVASPISLDVHVCGPPDEDPSCAGLGDSYGFGLARDGDELVGEQPWLAPGCGMPDYEATLNAVGSVTGTNEVSLTWTASITSPNPDWACNDYRPCTSTVEQRMAIATDTNRRAE